MSVSPLAVTSSPPSLLRLQTASPLAVPPCRSQAAAEPERGRVEAVDGGRLALLQERGRSREPTEEVRRTSLDSADPGQVHPTSSHLGLCPSQPARPTHLRRSLKPKAAVLIGGPRHTSNECVSIAAVLQALSLAQTGAVAPVAVCLPRPEPGDGGGYTGSQTGILARRARTGCSNLMVEDRQQVTTSREECHAGDTKPGEVTSRAGTYTLVGSRATCRRRCDSD